VTPSTGDPGTAERDVAAPVAAPIDLARCDAILLVVLDAASADAFSFLGGTLPTTPRLAALADEGVVATDHVPVTTGLNAAVATLLTGRHLPEHGVGSLHTLGRTRLRDEERTIAEALQERGWRTLLATGAPQLHPDVSGLHQGFSSIHVPALGEPVRRADQVVGACLPTLRRWVEAEEPVFALLQLSDLDARADRLAPEPFGAQWLDERLAAHAAPGSPVADALAKHARNPVAAAEDLSRHLARGRGSVAARAWREGLRDGRASALDHELGRVFDLLAARGRLDRTLIVVAGARGGVVEPPAEIVGPRLVPEFLRTPLVVRFPAGKEGTLRPRGRRERIVSAVDVPRALDQLMGLGLAPTRFASTDLVALVEGRLAPPANPPWTFVASADLALTALVTHEMQLERAPATDDLVFNRSGGTFTLADKAPELSREARAQLGEFSRPATFVIEAAPGAPQALEVAWRVESGLLTSAVVTGTSSEDTTPRHEAQRRRAGRARLDAAGRVEVGLTDRTAAVRLDLSCEEGLALWDPAVAKLHVGADLRHAFVPRLLVPRVVAWPADENGVTELPVVDVQRAVGATWRIAVNHEGPCEALVTVWPPRPPNQALAVEAGGAVVAERVPGRFDVIRLVGEAPWAATITKGPQEQLALVVSLGGEVVDARRVRIESRRMASDRDLSLLVPGFLPGVTQALFQPVGDGATWRVSRTDPAGTFGADQALAPDALDFLRWLPPSE
jgi:arylsulfatase A-like enzyme